MRSKTTTDSADETERTATDGSGEYSTTARRPWNRTGSTGGEDGDASLGTFAAAQAGVMLLVAAVLFTLEMWSPEFYFVVSFLGLLTLRIVLAPTDRVPTWWSRLNWVVRGGFVVFGYLVLQQLPELLP
ncbi:hypothetical protein SAMN04488124_3332 [Halogeometricum limi]|uniref:Uncharacterized protein n=2 Tax=Halogeometricum limi TaxID=555875 RepID=A0A1I6IKE2_9EURY|nr:hypothetical protein SAMN04488124_3332 [Halogeometricum limi]